MIFAYEKSDDKQARTSRLDIQHSPSVGQSSTGDFQTTSGLIHIFDNQDNIDSILAFFAERVLPVDDIQAQALAQDILSKPPK